LLCVGGALLSQATIFKSLFNKFNKIADFVSAVCVGGVTAAFYTGLDFISTLADIPKP
jgi:hypothetical protein